MTENTIFFCSSSPKSAKSTEIIIKSAIKKEESIKKEKLSVITPDSSKPARLVAAIRASLYFMTGKLLGRNALTMSHQGVPIGKNAVAASYRNPMSYKSNFLYYILLIKNIAKAIVAIDHIEKHKQQIKACYVNDPSYLNGVYGEWSVKNEIPVYHNKYPYRLARFSINKDKDFSEALLVQPSDRYTDEEIIAGENNLKERLHNTESIEYMQDTDFSDANNIETNIEAVIYCHSFTDAQQDFGGDNSFLNMLEWLKFTVEKLEHKKIMIKAHPNFYKKGYNTKVMEYDNHIFERFKKEIEEKENVYIVDWPVRNIDVLRTLPKDCVLISHHGNALLEGAYLGFKCISSSAAPGKKYHLFNEWSSVGEYEQLLDNLQSLKPTDKTRLYEFVYDLSLSPNSFFDSRGWRMKAAEKLGLNPREISQNRAVLERLSDPQIEELTSDIAREINEIYL